MNENDEVMVISSDLSKQIFYVGTVETTTITAIMKIISIYADTSYSIPQYVMPFPKDLEKSHDFTSHNVRITQMTADYLHISRDTVVDSSNQKGVLSQGIRTIDCLF